MTTGLPHECCCPADDISKLGGLQPDVSCSDFPKGGPGARSHRHDCPLSTPVFDPTQMASSVLDFSCVVASRRHAAPSQEVSVRVQRCPSTFHLSWLREQETTCSRVIIRIRPVRRRVAGQRRVHRRGRRHHPAVAAGATGALGALRAWRCSRAGLVVTAPSASLPISSSADQSVDRLQTLGPIQVPVSVLRAFAAAQCREM